MQSANVPPIGLEWPIGHAFLNVDRLIRQHKAKRRHWITLGGSYGLDGTHLGSWLIALTHEPSARPRVFNPVFGGFSYVVFSRPTWIEAAHLNGDRLPHSFELQCSEKRDLIRSASTYAGGWLRSYLGARIIA